MKFALAAAVVALLLGGTDAAHLEWSGSTSAGLVPSSSLAHVGNDGKKVIFGNFDNGCKSRTSSGIKQICLDDKKARAHVNYTSGLKRCFKKTSSYSEICGGDEGCWGGVCNRCHYATYSEAKCDW